MEGRKRLSRLLRQSAGYVITLKTLFYRLELYVVILVSEIYGLCCFIGGGSSAMCQIARSGVSRFELFLLFPALLLFSLVLFVGALLN